MIRHGIHGLSELVAALLLAVLAAGCERGDPPLERDALPSGAVPEVVRTSELQPGTPVPGARPDNPFEESGEVIRNGETFYTWFNCAGCHGALGGGGIGPPLRDADWIYGGRPDQIRMSILQGRPNGMPSYGSRIQDEVAWQIVSYVVSLGGAEEAKPANGEDEGGHAHGHPSSPTGAQGES